MTKIKTICNLGQKDLVTLSEELISLKRETRLMKRLVTTKGFYRHYYKYLKNFTNQEQAFGYVNELYQTLFGVYRFENYLTFRLLLNGNS